MKIIKPHALKKRDIIGICAPASAPDTRENLQRGVRYLERLGYRVKLGKNLSQRHGYLAGTDKQRAADMNDLFADPQVKAIFAARGGYGSHRILPLLNYPLIQKHPKIFVGYSDITALQLAMFAKTGLVTFSGPMVASNLGMKLNGKAEESFWDILTSPTIPIPLSCPEKLSQPSLAVKISTGRMLGGNLSLVAALVGTKYFPPVHDIILLLEEIDERPYRIDRLLQQIRLAGILNRSKGIALGQFVGCVPGRGKSSLTLSQVFREVFATFRYPVLGGIHYGHIKNTLTIPIGILSRLKNHSGKIEFLEAPVLK
jgi:muramoyltetrapeptide carboxypeptidase